MHQTRCFVNPPFVDKQRLGCSPSAHLTHSIYRSISTDTQRESERGREKERGERRREEREGERREKEREMEREGETTVTMLMCANDDDVSLSSSAISTATTPTTAIATIATIATIE